MARYYTDTPPAQLECVVCLLTLPVATFRPAWMRNRSPHAKSWRVKEVCRTCVEQRRRGRLTGEQLARYTAMADRANEQIAATLKAGRTMPKKVGKQRVVPQGHAPYDIVVRAMTEELGIPPERWTREHDFECTTRMYKMLGWPTDTLLQTIPAAQRARAAAGDTILLPDEGAYDDDE